MASEEPATVTRRGTFETNSSSTHSLVLAEAPLMRSPFPDDAIRAGFVDVELQGFGWEWARYYLPQNKAAYLIVGEIDRHSLMGSWDDDQHPERAAETEERAAAVATGDLRDYLCSKSERVAAVVGILERRSGCKVRIFGEGKDANSFGYIDHQSSDADNGFEGGTDMGVGKDEAAIEHFLFSESYVQTGNDNDDPPDLIQTDLGVRERF